MSRRLHAPRPLAISLFEEQPISRLGLRALQLSGIKAAMHLPQGRAGGGSAFRLATSRRSKDDDIYTADEIWKVLIPVSVLGWFTFGVICILCLNGRGRAGRWVPEWYLDSDRARKYKLAVVAWWLVVLVMWPVILPLLGARKFGQKVEKTLAEKRRHRAQLLENDKQTTAMAAAGGDC
ncbi:hypothetical protein RJ55_00093 [Drechmeria coniospora]|nr:hypothetical protein RJ55_00093 [Drechmeria coniospora]